MRTAIVTGAYGAIGRAIATGIARAGYRTVLIGRDRELLEKACSDISLITGNQDVEFAVIDLGLKEEILSYARRWQGSLDLLVNNHATAPRQRRETPEGVEVQWAVNVMGYFHLTRSLSSCMEGTEDPRIVFVAIYWAGELDMTDPEFTRRPYDNDTAYRQAKQANRMLSTAFASRLAEKGITVNACHPGDVNSKLSNAFGFGGSETPEEGAATPLFLALSPTLKGVSGHYYEHLREARCRFSEDTKAVDRLFRLCEVDY